MKKKKKYKVLSLARIYLIRKLYNILSKCNRISNLSNRAIYSQLYGIFFFKISTGGWLGIKSDLLEIRAFRVHFLRGNYAEM